MIYKLDNGKSVNIPDTELDKNMKLLDISQAEAIQLWLEDNDYEVNEEQAELNKKAKKVKINHDARAIKPKTDRKPKNVKVSDEKQYVFSNLKALLEEFFEESGGQVEVLNKNKLLQLKYGNKIFKIDLIEQRPLKNGKKSN